MLIKKIAIGYTIILILSSLAMTLTISAQDENLPFWNESWSTRQGIQIPINTESRNAKYQPIDTLIKFDKSCWTKNEKETSIRICCWDGSEWFELESQIYNLKFTDDKKDHIESCNIVFLIPDYADGNEQYFVYYDDEHKVSTSYENHVDVSDEYYFSTPFTDVSAEAHYYAVKEDGYYIYGVGQEGELLQRPLSQIIIKQKHHKKEFDALDSDQIVSFGFSYYYGNEEGDESASDQMFVKKEIFVDGNLMVKFGVISQSDDKNLKTTVIYKYYYNPLSDKRIDVQVKHEVLNKDIVVSGKTNIDGRFGSLLSFKARSTVVEKMNAGEILPYLHFYGERGAIEEYSLNLDPETKEREWIITAKDDADLGNPAWVSYDEGSTGKAQSVIFSSNSGIVQSNNDERDGVQLKVAEKEYFNLLGTEVDYVSISFGRNSYETGGTHDLEIPKGMVVEFDAEFFTTDNSGFLGVEEESKIYQKLVKQRQSGDEDGFVSEEETFEVKLISHFAGTRLTFPWLANKTGRMFPVMVFELYQEGMLVASEVASRGFLYRAVAKFSDIPAGVYLVKVFWKINNETLFFNGFKEIEVTEDSTTHVLCIWQRKINVQVLDQNDDPVEGVLVSLVIDDTVIAENSTDNDGIVEIKAPFYPRLTYNLRGLYNGFIIYDENVNRLNKNIEISLEIYDLTVEIKDTLGFTPGVEIAPILSSPDMNISSQLSAEKVSSGVFYYTGLPPSKYHVSVSYGGFIDEQFFDIPEDGDEITIVFSAEFDITSTLFDIRGNELFDDSIVFTIIRDKDVIYQSWDPQRSITLPPAQYKIKAYDDDGLIGVKNVMLTNNKEISFVTSITPMYPTLVIEICVVFIGVVAILSLIRKTSFTFFLKSFAIALIIISVMLPWWGLHGSSDSYNVESSTQLFFNPTAMVETLEYNGEITIDLALIPDIFFEFIGIILLITYTAIALLALSLLLLKLKMKKYSCFLTILIMLMLIGVTIAFTLVMSKLGEVSVGGLQGERILSVMVENEPVMVSSQWGLGIGFYLCIAGLLSAICSCFWEIKKMQPNWFKFKKK